MSCTSSSAHFLYEGAYFTYTETQPQKLQRSPLGRARESERNWGHTHTRDKVNKRKCTQLEPSNLFVETFEKTKEE